MSRRLSIPDLAAALHAATRYPAERAAIDLLAWHGTWLLRPEVTRHLTVDTARSGPHPVLAAIDWDAVAHEVAHGVAASSSEAAILSIALALAGGYDLDLRTAVVGLGGAHAAAVAMAVLRASGMDEGAVSYDRPREFPPGVRVVTVGGRVLQEAGQATEPERVTFDTTWPGLAGAGR
ncbi:MAG: hypothetical protein ACRDQ7_09295 [Haloechinothrix sp.]